MANSTGVSVDDRKLAVFPPDMSTGKKARLHRIMYGHGPGNGRALILPFDQGLEHGPRDFFDNPDSVSPSYQLRLAKEGNFSAVAFQIGLADKYFWDYAGEIPLVLKLNGKSDIPSDADPISPCNASVEDAVRLGADAVGYTLYVGSTRQDEDFMQLAEVREDCARFEMPLVVWSYPRGAAMKAKGGIDTQYAIEYAARIADELGADVAKVNYPKLGATAEAPKPYDSLELTHEEAVSRVITAAGRAKILISGGSKGSDEDVIDKARISLEAGAMGLIFGRNIWQRPWDESLKMVEKLHSIFGALPDPDYSG